ncbi:MAG: inositol phosphorylceramide synthase [Euryarchaeota archaeon]|nr:inositol phosphorylceramide synthase [Euryarchaeota archaeon]NDF36488.1 inositol phosphorylceramide synthase [Euryarchaeota archaeon]
MVCIRLGRIYLTWVTAAILCSVALMPFLRPRFVKHSWSAYVDMFRRYWFHMLIVFSVYLWKDPLDQIDRALMASTRIEITPYIYAIEGDVTLWVQSGFKSPILTEALTHFYVMGYMTAIFSAFIYPIYADDRYMADRVALTMFYVYILALPFYLFLNVRVTGDVIPGMETLAYDLTPEIRNWFVQIDPFTNGMPSLHIGMPFAIWLAFVKWDEDGRWHRFSMALLAFIFLTAFSIVYLGIHWISDMLGGLLVAHFAVLLADKTRESVWGVFDERLIGRRFALMIDNPRQALRKILKMIQKAVEPYRQASRKQTSLAIVTVLFLTTTILVYDATHQSFPLEGVEVPSEATGEGEWMIAINDTADEDTAIIAWNLSTSDSYEVGGAPWPSPPSVEISGQKMVIYGGFRFDWFEIDPSFGIISPEYRNDLPYRIDDLGIGTTQAGDSYVALLNSSIIEVMSPSGSGIVSIEEVYNVTSLTVSGDSVFWGTDRGNGPELNIFSVSTETRQSYFVNASSDRETEMGLKDAGIEVDPRNGSITEISADSTSIAVTVDVGAMRRIVLLDRVIGSSEIISEPAWDAWSPHLTAEKLVYLQVTAFVPDGESETNRYNDVYLFDRSIPDTVRLTSGSESIHEDPRVVSIGAAWLVTTGDDSTILEIYDMEDPFEPYSRILLQAAVVMLVPLLMVWTVQTASESRSNQVSESLNI